jgi:hypothetical protein
MAPVALFPIAQTTARSEAPHLFKRTMPETTLISLIILLVIATILLLAATSFFIRRWLTNRQLARHEKEANEAATPPPLAERRQSNWARQNSNVLWSMYINDDDLRAQFSQPRKDSRLFSIGSVSTVDGRCPLDTGRPSVAVEHDEKPASLNPSVEAAKAADERVPVPPRSTARRATYANVQTQKGNGWFGGLGKRKMSATAV